VNRYSNDPEMILMKQNLEILKRNFDWKKEIKVILVAGVIRSGKSTFLNILRFVLNEEIDEDTFKAAECVTSYTQGLWFYPRPLFFKNN
jgi:predicted AAA+ superfamily ATPase